MDWLSASLRRLTAGKAHLWKYQALASSAADQEYLDAIYTIGSRSFPDRDTPAAMQSYQKTAGLANGGWGFWCV